MKDELNNYKINNLEGTGFGGETKIRIDNEDPRFIKEDALSGQDESFSVNETFDDKIKEKASKKSSKSDDGNSGSQSSSSSASSSTGSSASSSASSSAGSSASSTASSAASSAASAASSAASAAASSIGAVAGSVAGAVATAAVVVATFVSTLAINISLVMATMFGLTFEVQMTGAQEEDFETAIVAVLEGEDYSRTIDVLQDTVYLSFDGLQPGKEYVLTVKNNEKVFVKKSFFTATEEVKLGSVTAEQIEENKISVSVGDIELKSGEFWTLTAKDENGNVIFAKDGTEKEFSDSFDIPASANGVYFTLSVGGKARAVSQVEVYRAPEGLTPDYDFDNLSWVWAENYSSAIVYVTDRNGGESLGIEATVSTSQSRATCEENAAYIYHAVAVYETHKLSDDKRVEIAGTAAHIYGELVAAQEPTEYEMGNVAYYWCERCNKYFDEEYNELSREEVYIPKLEYDYDNPVWNWEVVDGVPADEGTISFVEKNGRAPLVVPLSIDTRKRSDATCETAAVYIKVADTSGYDGYLLNFYTKDSEPYSVGESLGHDYVYVKNYGDLTYYRCPVCEKLFVYEDGEYIETNEIVSYVAGVTSGNATTYYVAFDEALSAWTSGSTLVLFEDVEITERISVNGGVDKTLDLNGKTVTLVSSASEQRIIDVNGSETVFTLIDSSGTNAGRLTGINPVNDNGWSGAIYINSGATVNMRGGTITGNTSENGAGVWIDGRGHAGNATFNMYGGVITGNTANKGGGVYVGCQLNQYAGTAQFNIDGGVITDNSATYGNGVYVDKGVISVKGASVIDEIYLLEGKVINLNGELTGDTRIGVTMQTAGVLTSGWMEYMMDADPADYFAVNGDYVLILVDGEVVVHAHDYVFFEANYEDNGLAAHYECGLCGKYFVYENGEYSETDREALLIGQGGNGGGNNNYDGLELNFNGSAIYINPTGYSRNSSFSDLQSFVSTSDNKYVLSGSCEGDETLDIYNKTGQKAVFYFVFDNITLTPGSWSTTIRIIANADVDIYIYNLGTSTVNTSNNHPAFESQSEGQTYHANIYFYSENGSNDLVIGGSDGRRYSAENGTSMDFYINDVKQ